MSRSLLFECLIWRSTRRYIYYSEMSCDLYRLFVQGICDLLDTSFTELKIREERNVRLYDHLSFTVLFVCVCVCVCVCRML